MDSSPTRLTAASNSPWRGSPSRSRSASSIPARALSRHFWSRCISTPSSLETACIDSPRSSRSANDWLTYAKEELRHLEKMYKSNDLTESTEEIILRRQRDMVERANFYVKMAEHDREYMYKVGLPRKEEGLKENNVKQTLTLEKTNITLPLLLNQKRLLLDKMKFERERGLTGLPA